MTPPWLHILSIVSITVAIACAIIIVVDELAGHKQHMWIMNVVWPVTALWSGPVGLIAYYTIGRTSTDRAVMDAMRRNVDPPNKTKPFWQSVAVGATHCGGGCTLADLIVEWSVLAVPLALFGNEVFGAWVADFVAAYVLGIVFQYFTIAPMRNLSFEPGLVAALKADTASLIAWQLGMYGWMAIALFVLFSPETLPKTSPDFWFMMQIAMAAGFLVSYPVNWWLLRSKIKELM